MSEVLPVDFARELIIEAGALALSTWRRPAALVVERKADRSLVTAADRAIESLLARRIAEAYPDQPVVGEETSAEQPAGYPVHALGAPAAWVLDPIDGTANYAAGSPDWCVSIALLVAGEPALGAAYFPARGNELYIGTRAGLQLFAGTSNGPLDERPLDFLPDPESTNLVATYEGAFRRYRFAAPLLPRVTGCMVLNLITTVLRQVRATLTSAFLWDVAAPLAFARDLGFHPLAGGPAVTRFTAATVFTDSAEGTPWRLRSHHVLARERDLPWLRRGIERLGERP